MHSSKIKVVPNTVSSLRICRACLATDVLLYDMNHDQNRLMEAYTRLVNTKESLPHYLCSYCAALILKCDVFRMRCIDALIVLRKVELDDRQSLQLSMRYIQKITQKTNKFTLPYCQTEVQFLNINEVCEEDIKMNVDNEIIESNAMDEEYLIDNDESMTGYDENVNNGIKDVVADGRNDCGNQPYKGDIDEFIQELTNDGPDDEFPDTTVLDSKGIIKPNFIINNETNDHNYALNQNANDHIGCVVQEYLQKIGKTDILKNFQINLFCNETTLAKINNDKKMKIKIIDEVDSTVMNDKLQKLLNRNGNAESDNSILRSLLTRKQYRPNKKKCKLKPTITNDGKYITIDFEDVSKKTDADLIDDKINTYTQNGIKWLPIEEFKNFNEDFPDFVLMIFGKKYNMDVTFMHTREEKIKGLEERKNTDNYKLSLFKCEYCYKGFDYFKTYNKHMLLHDSSRGNHECEICHLRMRTKDSYKQHTTYHSYKFTCKQCVFTTSYKSVARDHFLVHNGEKFPCKHCGKQYNGRNRYYAHLKISHPTNGELVRCEMCGDSFHGHVGLRKHEKYAHVGMKSQEYRCRRCNTQFYCSDAFKAHQGADGLCITTHKYCVRCGMSFETEQLLKEHYIEQQKPCDNFECEVCKKKFTNYTYYNGHRASHFKGQRRKEKEVRNYIPSMCELCGDVLQNRGLLKLHHRKKHLNYKPHKCTCCSKRFHEKMALKNHMHVHTGERPYECRICSKAFRSPTNLNRHMLVHTGERPHLCSICGKSFQTTNCVKIHVKNVHMRVPSPPKI